MAAFKPETTPTCPVAVDSTGLFGENKITSLTKSFTMQNETLAQMIERLAINQSDLALQMNMPRGTFKNKLSDNQLAYDFTTTEKAALLLILQNKAMDIIAGINAQKKLR